MSGVNLNTRPIGDNSNTVYSYIKTGHYDATQQGTSRQQDLDISMTGTWTRETCPNLRPDQVEPTDRYVVAEARLRDEHTHTTYTNFHLGPVSSRYLTSGATPVYTPPEVQHYGSGFLTSPNTAQPPRSSRKTERRRRGVDKSSHSAQRRDDASGGSSSRP